MNHDWIQEAAREKLYRKTALVPAVQWTGDNLREVIDFCGWHESASSKWTWDEYVDVVKDKGLKIFTLEGPLMARVGDWILKGPQGECWPCKQDIFEKTYEPAIISRLSGTEGQPLFTKGQIVAVNHERFHGEGIVQYDTGDTRKRVVGVLLENGNTWEYEVETVRALSPTSDANKESK